MTGLRFDEKPLNLRGLLGVGLDGRREELRVTRGANFWLYGGSQDTHGRMVDTALKFNEKIDERGKSIEQINARELAEIARELREDR